jgi:hypothetical protein
MEKGAPEAVQVQDRQSLAFHDAFVVRSGIVRYVRHDPIGLEHLHDVERAVGPVLREDVKVAAHPPDVDPLDGAVRDDGAPQVHPSGRVGLVGVPIVDPAFFPL